MHQPVRIDEARVDQWRVRLVGVTAVAADAVAIVFGAALTSVMFDWDYLSHVSAAAALGLSLYTLTFFLFARSFGLYRHDARLLELVSTARILQASFYSLILLTVAVYYTFVRVEPLALIVGGGLVTTSLLFEKHFLRKPLARWSANHRSTRNALIIGANSEARRVFSLFRNSPSLGFDPVAFLDVDQDATEERRIVYGHDYKFREHAEVRTGPLTRELLQELQIRMIFVADDRLSPAEVSEIELQAEGAGAEISMVFSGTSQRHGRAMNVHAMDGLLIDFSGSFQADRPGYRIAKRAIDVLGAAVLTLVTLPLWLAIAIAIRISSPGPILFQQERVGQGGILFPMFKFRSMYADASKYARSPESADDPRITKVGRLLRRTSLDELPQLLNVLRGEMSLVGPRPEMPYVVQTYDTRVRERLSVQQGVTGIWQLSADRRYAIHETVEYDFYYIRHRGLFLDLAILLHTVAFAMKGI